MSQESCTPETTTDSPNRAKHRRLFYWVVTVLIVCLSIAVGLPYFLKPRKRSRASAIRNDLRLIDAAIDQYAIEYNLTAGTTITWDQIKPYLKTNGPGGQNTPAQVGPTPSRQQAPPSEAQHQEQKPALHETAGQEGK